MSLEAHLKQLILETGPISIAKFMEEALSNPRYGYYQLKDPFGEKGDFITAPEISQIFGELIGIWCAQNWQHMGSPQEFMLVEMGPGRGTLMMDLLRGTKHIPHFHEQMEVHFIETSPALTQMQQKRFRSYKGVRFYWHTHISMLPEKPMALVANELFDALPVHQFIKTTKGWREKMVGLNDNAGKLTFMLSPDETGVTRMLSKKYTTAPEGAVVEWCPAGLMLMEEISSRLRRHKGAALIIDYGYEQPGFMETLQAVKAHHFHPVLETPGNADITAHVDFSELAEVAHNEGVKSYGPITQSDFLREMGVEIRAKTLLQHADEVQQNDIVSGVERLMSPAHMGELFKVLAVLSQGLPKPVGF